MNFNGYDFLVLSAVLVTGSALLFGKAFLWPSFPKEVAATFLGSNPFQVRNAIIQRYESVAGAVWLIGSLVAFLIGNALGDNTQYLIDRWSDSILLTVAGGIAWIGTIAITKVLGQRRYLPRMIEMQRDVFELASSVIKHDGLYKREVGQSSVVVDLPTRQQRRADATRHLDQIGKLIDLPRKPEEADADYFNRIQPFFLGSPPSVAAIRGKFGNTTSWLQAISTLVLVLITAYYAFLTHKLVKVQVDPQLSFEIEPLPSGAELLIANDGAYPVIDISIDPEITVYLGPPKNQKAFEVRKIPGRKGSHWWELPRLNPGEVRYRTITELGEESLRYTKMLEAAKTRGNLMGVSPKEQIQFWPAIIFRMTAYREADLKRYRKVKTAVVFSDSNTGKPIIRTIDYVALPYLQEILKELSKQERP